VLCRTGHRCLVAARSNGGTLRMRWRQVERRGRVRGGTKEAGRAGSGNGRYEGPCATAGRIVTAYGKRQAARAALRRSRYSRRRNGR